MHIIFPYSFIFKKTTTIFSRRARYLCPSHDLYYCEGHVASWWLPFALCSRHHMCSTGLSISLVCHYNILPALMAEWYFTLVRRTLGTTWAGDKLIVSLLTQISVWYMYLWHFIYTKTLFKNCVHFYYKHVWTKLFCSDMSGQCLVVRYYFEVHDCMYFSVKFLFIQVTSTTYTTPVSGVLLMLAWAIAKLKSK